MARPTVASLTRTLGFDLAPAEGFTAQEREVTAVHISELLDPGGYLTGGELLLSTGLALSPDAETCAHYVARLVHARVSALALGLGPVHTSVPPELARACRNVGLTLLVVPGPTPFLRITTAYWEAVSRATERHLHDLLARHRALVDAAASPAPVSDVLRALSRALNGWAATFTPAGEVDQVWPAAAGEDARVIGTDLRRVRGAGVHSAASFATGSTRVLVYPLAVAQELAGYLAFGAGGTLAAPDRHLVLAAAGLISLERVRRTETARAELTTERCVTELVVQGEAQAAGVLARRVGLAPPSDPARVLAVQADDVARVVAAVRAWCPDALRIRVEVQHADLLLPAAAGSLRDLRTALDEADSSATVLLSEEFPLARAGVRVDAARARLAQMAPGERSLSQSGPGLAWEALAELSEPAVTALAAYLRHHGQWESAARELGCHRNTLRQRIARCEQVLGVDLKDPDVTAPLWLGLRARGLA